MFLLKQKIQKQLKNKHKSLKDLCLFIEMSDTGIRKIFARDSCELATLEKIANFFQISIYDLLECKPECKEETKLETHGAASPIQTGGGSLSVTVGERPHAADGQASPDVLAEKVRSLSALVAEKDERISELKETIADLRAR